jgi:23S rRNA (cytidine1920-2'-O)/16S rRNA (cytidine1409-2'-O)-methyltransferase
VADKPGRLVADAEPLVVADDSRRFVSRGGDKLDAALLRFAIDARGTTALDAGASTGGFTDCLLHHGAAHVVAVDVGHGQLDPRLRADRRVTVVERTNIRTVDPARLGGPFSVVVADLSFISLTAVVPVLAGPLAASDADLVLLVKPQFEAGREQARRGRGVIRDPTVRRQALERVASALDASGASIIGAMASPVLGPAGNVEFLLHARAHTAPAGPGSGPLRSVVGDLIETALAESPDRPPDGGSPVVPSPGRGGS